MREGVYSEQKEDDHKSKIYCKEKKCIYFGDVCNRQGYMVAWFWGITVSYLLYIPFEKLSARDTTGCRLGVILVTWCIFKLDCCVNLCITCLIII